jgi:hypothetical protein
MGFDVVLNDIYNYVKFWDKKFHTINCKLLTANC